MKDLRTNKEGYGTSKMPMDWSLLEVREDDLSLLFARVLGGREEELVARQLNFSFAALRPCHVRR